MNNSIINSMTTKQRTEILSGANFWQTKPIDELDIPSIFLTDGPHGVRKQKENLDVGMLNNSFESTAFPTLSCVVSSWDEELINRMGEAIGKEANEENVDVLLGPGLNIKRMPTCGRNFEYLSEDPYLSGKMAASYVRGVQSTGVSACLKHFVCSNMEQDRMIQDVLVDERALREIYLKGFEIAIKEASPVAVMSAYNKLNGHYCSEHSELLTSILRREWGFTGAVISDWGAVSDPVKATNAGLSLEMPANKRNDLLRNSAVQKGFISETVIDERVKDVLGLVQRAKENYRKGDLYVASTHHELARKIASESMVLLKNDEILPLDKEKKYLVIGDFAKNPVIQGAGSSLVNPTNVDTVYDEFTKRGIEFVYADENSDTSFIETMANIVDGVILFAWLDSSVESESFDREDLKLPFNKQRELNNLLKYNDNTVLVVTSGSPVTIDTAAPAIIQTYLAGQAGASALVDILFGEKNPCGKLAETYPSDSVLPSHFYYDTTSKQAKYVESIFVGYRYYDKKENQVLFPFGHGLSYTTFEYSNLEMSSEEFDGETLKVSFEIENTGDIEGREIAQLYVRDVKSTVYKPVKELKGFKKIKLVPGEKKKVELELDSTSFSYYSTVVKEWVVEPGEYEILIGASSADIRLKGTVFYKKDEEENLVYKPSISTSVYFELGEDITDSDFESIYGEVPVSSKADIITVNNSLYDIKDTFFGKKMLSRVKTEIAKVSGTTDESDSTYKMLYKMQTEMPLRALSDFSNGALSYNKLLSIIEFVNKNYFKALVLYFKAIFKKDNEL